ncbi:probable cytochrome P450 49a1 isoform X2 [Haliotis cracherodii]|uniref:probable cytochrome P450 49a1 isoform X2 n=1 Tax=Haliotis cracherodii TaxID=6455 RepID=UPI0039ECEB24
MMNQQNTMKKQIASFMSSKLSTARAAHVATAHPVNIRTENSKSLEAIPGPSGIRALPYIGPAFMFRPFGKFRPDKLNLLFQELHQKYGKIVKFRKGSSWAVFLFDPSLIEVAMRHEGRYPKRPSMPLLDTYCKRSGAPPGISQLTGKEWYDVRKPVQDRTMKPHIVAQYLPSQRDVADDMVSTIKSQQLHVDDMSKLLFRYTAESTGLFCFNVRLGFLDHRGCPMTRKQEDMLKSIRQFLALVAQSFYTFPTFKLYPNKMYRTFEKVYGDVQKTGQVYVESMYRELCEKKASGTLDPHEPNLLLALLNDDRLPKEACFRVMSSFFTVATENVAKSLSLSLWLLAKNKDKQEILYQEIISVCGTGKINATSLSHMPYLKACVKEGHRLGFPSPVGSVRIIDKDLQLDGYHIPRGTEVHYGHNVLCHSPEYFDTPKAYIPERWLRDSGNNTNNYLQSFIVMPFGFGTRNCPGRRFAEQQLFLALITLIQSFEISLQDPEEQLSIVYNILATKETPLELNFKQRKK